MGKTLEWNDNYGGTNHQMNLNLACLDCNREKGPRYMGYTEMCTLRKEFNRQILRPLKGRLTQKKFYAKYEQKFEDQFGY